jgi:hypothetical protein
LIIFSVLTYFSIEIKTYNVMAPIIKEKRHLVGLILLAIGFLLIIENLKFVPDFMPWWIWTWQFLLITIGAFSLLTTDNKGPGIILIGIGTIFLLPDIMDEWWPGFFDLFEDDSRLFIYLILIVIGISLIFRSSSGFNRGFRGFHNRWNDRSSDYNKSDGKTVNAEDSAYDSNDYIDEVAIFGGGEKIITSQNFRGGKVTAIFGGTDLVLLHAQLAPGVHQLEVFAMFGGWTLRIPPNWQVKSEVVAIFGGVSDKRYIGPDTIKDNTRQLIIKGFVLFGGGEIK